MDLWSFDPLELILYGYLHKKRSCHILVNDGCERVLNQRLLIFPARVPRTSSRFPGSDMNQSRANRSNRWCTNASCLCPCSDLNYASRLTLSMQASPKIIPIAISSRWVGSIGSPCFYFCQTLELKWYPSLLFFLMSHVCFFLRFPTTNDKMNGRSWEDYSWHNAPPSRWTFSLYTEVMSKWASLQVVSSHLSN